jgi:hypothetical protein
LISFDYIERKTRRGESVWSASVTVTITGGRKPIKGPMLVDTGADRTHIPTSLGVQVFDLAACDELSMVWGHDQKSAVYAPRAYVVATVDGLVSVPIRPVIGAFGSPVLGMDFLAHFRATFDGRARRLTLEPVDSASA